MELTKEKSEGLAFLINSIKVPLYCIDVEYAKEVVSGLLAQAERQDSMAVLNPLYNPEKQNVLRLQSKMLDHIVKFIELGKEVDRLKESIVLDDQARQKIQSLFI